MMISMAVHHATWITSDAELRCSEMSQVPAAPVLSREGGRCAVVGAVRIGILGSGVVGQTLARGYAVPGHEARIGTRKSDVDGLPVGSPAEVVADADLVVLAVQGTVAVELVSGL